MQSYYLMLGYRHRHPVKGASTRPAHCSTRLMRTLILGLLLLMLVGCSLYVHKGGYSRMPAYDGWDYYSRSSPRIL